MASEEGLEIDLEEIIDSVGVIWKLADVNGNDLMMHTMN